MARDKFGIIPDDHFENEPTYPAKNVSPLSRYWIDRIAVWKRRKEQDTDPNYRPGDLVGGYWSRDKSGKGVGVRLRATTRPAEIGYNFGNVSGDNHD